MNVARESKISRRDCSMTFFIVEVVFFHQTTHPGPVGSLEPSQFLAIFHGAIQIFKRLPGVQDTGSKKARATVPLSNGTFIVTGNYRYVIIFNKQFKRGNLILRIILSALLVT